MHRSFFNFLTGMFFFLVAGDVQGQSAAWQQKVRYTMNIDLDVSTNRFTGKQKLEYTNNSPDVLKRVFYHLYYNAFQPNSSMDVRSRELGKQQVNGRPDWDARVRDRISKLTETEIGYQKIKSVRMNGLPQEFVYHETILEVKLKKPIAPGATVVLDMEFEAQVPLQIRRTGRDNPSTTVRYSMSQWYPKLCEYDAAGWHPTPYIAREFYGVWGDYDVTIQIDASYKLGGTGVLTNAREIGWGYDVPGSPLKPTSSDKRKWRFVASNVHDFVWAADPGYRHITRILKGGGPVVHVLYKNTSEKVETDADWNKVAEAAELVLPFIESKFGKYPYPQYSFIHGGDGGMEYPMATLLAGPGLGTVFHEWMHSWYQMMLGTNESLYAWMDEGFTEFATDLVEAWYRESVTRKSLEGNPAALRQLDSLSAQLPLEHVGNYSNYYYLAKSPWQEPLTTHADHFNSNFGYSISSYSKGCVFLEQLGYITGAAARDSILLAYYRSWRFRHPGASDFIKVAEDVSGMKLDWYQEYWCNTTKTIDYAIDSLWEEGGASKIRIRRIGQMPMPIDVQLDFSDGNSALHYVPLNLQYGSKPAESEALSRKVHEPWRWTHPTYVITFSQRLASLKRVQIDPTKRMADVDQRNNDLKINW
jgi:hypothetical protein